MFLSPTLGHPCERFFLPMREFPKMLGFQPPNHGKIVLTIQPGSTGVGVNFKVDVNGKE